MNNKTENIESAMGEVLYDFETPEFIHHRRGDNWFIGLGIFVILGVILGIYDNSLSVILLSIMIGSVYTLTSNITPKIINIKFTTFGVLWKEKFFLYQDIEKFWILWEPNEVQTLHIWLGKGILKEVIIPIENQKIDDIRNVLGYYLPEEEKIKEPVSNIISRKFKL
jgi:hypothetical protein